MDQDAKIRFSDQRADFDGYIISIVDSLNIDGKIRKFFLIKAIYV